MKPHHRVLLFCMTLFFADPALYALGDWLQGPVLAALLPIAASLGAYGYARAGEKAGAERESRQD